MGSWQTQSDVETATDFLGQEYRVGDFIVYATTSGRSPVQKFARVERILKVTKTTEKFGYIDGKFQVVSVDESDSFKVGVKEISNGRGFIRWDSRVYDESKPIGERTSYDFSKVRTTYPMTDNIVKVNVSV
jgi:hypothetical protein